MNTNYYSWPPPPPTAPPPKKTSPVRIVLTIVLIILLTPIACIGTACVACTALDILFYPGKPFDPDELIGFWGLVAYEDGSFSDDCFVGFEFMPDGEGRLYLYNAPTYEYGTDSDGVHDFTYTVFLDTERNSMKIDITFEDDIRGYTTPLMVTGDDLIIYKPLEYFAWRQDNYTRLSSIEYKYGAIIATTLNGETMVYGDMVSPTDVSESDVSESNAE